MRYSAVLGVLFGILLLVAAAGRADSAGGPVRLVVTGLRTIGQDEFREMLGLGGVETIDADIVRRGIKTAFLKGIFEDIAVTVHGGDPETVEVVVRERNFIRKIEVTGDHELSEKTIRRLFLFKEDEQMRDDLIPQAVSDLKAALANLGFPLAEVSITTGADELPYRVNVFLHVSTGQPQIIKSIAFAISTRSAKGGEEPGGAGEGQVVNYKDLFGISVGDVANRERIEQEIVKMRDLLKKQGYIGPVVGPYTFVDGALEIMVHPGKRLDLVFDGNQSLSTNALIRESLLRDSEDINDDVVGEAVDRMLSYYHTEGYPFAQIAPVIRSRDNEVSLSFFIFEGQRVKVRSITFAGTDLSAENLKQVMVLKEHEYFNPDQVEKDKDLLREFLGALGYLEASVRKIDVRYTEDKSRVDLSVDLLEGEKTIISSIDFTGGSPENTAKLKAIVGIRAGDPYNEVDISDARFRILEYYKVHGYATVDASVRRKIADRKASVVFEISEGRKLYLGRTVIMGNYRTKYLVIQRELLHKEGEVFNQGIFAEERQRLYKLGLFTDVEIETNDFDGDRRDVLVTVHEGNAGSVEFGLGYGEYEGIRGFFEVSYRNLWGLNREALARVEASSIEKRYLLQYNEPWAFGRRLPLRVFFEYDKKREIASARETLYRLTRYALTAGVENRLSSVMKYELYYEFSLVRTADVRPDVILTKEDTGTLAISSIKPALVYDTRDNPFEPGKGVLAGASLKFASSALLSETNFLKLEVYGSRFHTLSKNIVLALSARGGIAYHFGATQELPLVERFFLGGRSTVRGYDQDTLGPKGADGNPTGGNVFAMGNIEFRTSVGKGFGIVPFVDMGNVWVNTKRMVLSDLRFTAGLGLRYKTPVGPLRVDYGMKLNREPGESRGAIHFSVGHAF
ncbi:MAG: outer membrane protein assembly factor BamA [Nitrospiraceae bacterium]|nr:outer membrane protein assembly factor BamA [Nitrospiraceae bacterium]